MLKVNPNANANGTSFHGSTIQASVNQIVAAFGEPCCTSDESDKVQNEWCFELDGEPVTLYDWKEYRRYSRSARIEWHVGGNSKSVTDSAASEIQRMLK